MPNLAEQAYFVRRDNRNAELTGWVYDTELDVEIDEGPATHLARVYLSEAQTLEFLEWLAARLGYRLVRKGEPAHGKEDAV